MTDLLIQLPWQDILVETNIEFLYPELELHLAKIAFTIAEQFSGINSIVNCIASDLLTFRTIYKQIYRLDSFLFCVS